MATALVTVVVGLAAVLAGTEPAHAAQAEPCAQVEQWEADAHALADELAGVPGADADELRQELGAVGFVAGAPAPDAGGRPDLLTELLAAVVGALDTDGDGEVPVTVLGPPAC